MIRPRMILCFATMRNEMLRLPHFLAHYRKLGVAHFLIVDNGSNDGTAEYLTEQPDVSLWTTPHAYRLARFGMDWVGWLQWQYGHGHWCLTVDADEFILYPFYDTRPIRALADWLDACEVRSFGAMLLDMYPKGPVSQAVYSRGQDPLQVANWFDAGNYVMSRNRLLRNLWIQGGPRARMFFAEKPKTAPALNKIPFVKWRKPYTYVSSTHMMLPRGLNLVYDQAGGEKTSGILLHAKFMNTFHERAADEAAREQHYQKGQENQSYVSRHGSDPTLWSQWSEEYINWRQLEELGLMSKGNWA